MFIHGYLALHPDTSANMCVVRIASETSMETGCLPPTLKANWPPEAHIVIVPVGNYAGVNAIEVTDETE
jgi:hypothetical protein